MLRLIWLSFFSLLLISNNWCIFAKEQEVPSKKYIENTEILSRYRYLLGPGDLISLKMLNISGFDNNFKIIPDGTINLPRLGSIYISGMTIDEATLKITERYKTILKYPLVYIKLLSPRPIKVSIVGEVQKPGVYSLSNSNLNNISNSDGEGSTPISSEGWPTLVDGLQKAGGITSDANLRKVILKRNFREDLKEESFSFNLWSILDDGERVLNPFIYDGDIIKVKKATKLENEEILKISKSNFAPATIAVNVVGEVSNPGNTKIRSGAPLTEAILAAGGLSSKASKTNITLYRLNNNGSIAVDKYEYKPDEKLNSKSNPALKNRDVLLVGKSSWARFNSGLNSLVQPLAPVIQAGAVYRLLSD